MEIITQEKEYSFQKLFELLPSKEQTEIRKTAIEKYGWSRTNFYNKQNGSPLWAHETTQLIEIMNNCGIDARFENGYFKIA